MAATAYGGDGAKAKVGEGTKNEPADAKKSGFMAKLEATKKRWERYAVFRILVSTAEGFSKDRVTTHAAAMTYYGVFSLFPLILVFMALAGLALQSNEAARQQVLNVVIGLLPQGQDSLEEMLTNVIKAKGAAAGIGTLLLLWSALNWFQVIDANVNEIWGVGTARSFIKAKLFALLMVASIGGVALLSFAATAAVQLLAKYTNVIPGSTFVWQVVVSLLSVLTMAGAFYVLYRYAPQRHIQFSDIWPAAVATAVIWEITRTLVSIYLQKTNMVSGYGSIGAVMALLFWIYIVSIIILSGAELSYAIAKERRHIAPEEEMKVVAPPGEQPTGKFAWQVGTGGNGTPSGADGEAVPAEAAKSEAGGQADTDTDQKKGRRAAPEAEKGQGTGDDRPRIADQPRGVALEAPVAVLAGVGLGFLASRLRQLVKS